MRNVVKYIMQAGLVVCLMLFFLVGCDKENDFYEVGRQPVFLTSPENEAIWTLNYQKPDSMYLFSWESKRQFIYFNLVMIFGLAPQAWQSERDGSGISAHVVNPNAI